MGEQAKPDFSGYATKAGLKCTDGRTITPDAFKDQDGMKVPLVWQHQHNDPEQVLGHAILYHVSDGMRFDAFFNNTQKAQSSKILVTHGDIEAVSIFANQLIEKSKKVLHGVIRELSLVLAAANPGALIDNVSIIHSDDTIETLEDEAIIFTGLELELEHADNQDNQDNQDSGPTIQEVYDTLDEDQMNLVHYLVGAAVEEALKGVEHDSLDDDDNNDNDNNDDDDDNDDDNNDNNDNNDDKDDVSHSDESKEGKSMKHNVFEDNEGKGTKDDSQILSHDALQAVVEDAKKRGTTLKDAFEHYALKHGINDIEVLFPEAVNVTDTPELNARRTEWVAQVLDGTKHTPFSRLKSLVADVTFEEARAKGYVKGNLKKEEWVSVSKRITTPATVYKKQKLDRDDIIDITDFDVVIWLKNEMRLMLDEEIARAVLIGDGRDSDDEDKIKDPAGAAEGAGIRSIMNDHELYAPTVMVDDSATGVEIVDKVTEGMALYKGSGSPVLYTTLPFLTNLLMTRDQFNHRLWKNADELATELGVSKIVNVEVMEDEPDLVGIVVNLRDYTIGTDKGGEVNFFDFFDIDYNQYKYLYESRMSGALTKIRSAIVFKRAAEGSTLITPDSPTFDDDTSAVTIPTQAHVKYYNKEDLVTDISGDTVSLDEGEVLQVIAIADSGYYFADNAHDEWTFQGVATD